MKSSLTHRENPVPVARLVLGGAILVAGFLSPLALPLVTRSALPPAWKTTLAGLLLLGIPELFTLIAAGVLGRQGFDFLVDRVKGALRRFFRVHGPPQTVGRTRYRIGLVMFIAPVMLGWIAPYVSHHLPGYEQSPNVYAVSGDLLLITSLFVLGGEFWDKLRSLFIQGAVIRWPDDEIDQ